jgi:hypothetical protein
MRSALYISLFLAIVTSLLVWVPWGRSSGKSVANQDTLLTASGESVAPEKVADIRVASFDANEKAPKVFQVARKNGKWVIPSHWDYPADGGSKVGETAGSALNLQHGPLVSSRKETHGEYGVIDPLAENLTGDPDTRGRRVTLKDEGGGVLVDLIVGKSVGEQSDLHYVRTASSDDVYTAKVDLSSVSTAFRDWVETDPLKISRSAISGLTIRDYSVDEERGTVKERSRTALDLENSAWTSSKTPEGQQVKQTGVSDLLTELQSLRLVGVRPFDPQWLEQRGFYVGRKQAGGYEIYGNEGELDISTNDGLKYRLFFGEIAVGDEQDTAAAPTTQATTKPSGNNRYMAVFVEYDPKLDKSTPPSTQPTSQPVGPTTQQIEAGEKLAKQKLERFSQFFYVISDDTFRKLRPEASAVFEPKPAPATAPTTEPSSQPSTQPAEEKQ